MKGKLLKIAYYLVPGLVFASLWIPIIGHYYIPDISISDKTLRTARLLPADTLLEKLKNHCLFFLCTEVDKKKWVGIGEKLLTGELAIPGQPITRITLPFDSSDLEKGPPRQQLLFAGFAVPQILLNAYQVTGRDDFMNVARDVIAAWAAYERGSWLPPRGLQWNDHALAARIFVLAEFWRLYRNHPSYSPAVAKAVFQLVARSGQFLTKSSHFTFATNHGIMQNLALWHLTLAFPTLPDTEQYKKLALTRMSEQMTFYINDEGVFLEHSASYQSFGLKLLGMAFRYLTLMEISIPDDWRLKYTKAKDFYAQLRRPDDSLPVFGDTTSGRHFQPPIATVDAHGRSGVLEHKKNWLPQVAYGLYPVAGYALWWDGLERWPQTQQLSQTVLTWSFFPGHSHKHADEMSVLLWAGGQTWWTNLGFWPYGMRGRSESISWDGSNAPHLIGEPTTSVRNTRLRAVGQSDNIAVIDLERHGPKAYVARRQLVFIRPHVWIVIDHVSGNTQSRTTWTTPHNMNMTQGGIPGSYRLHGTNQRSTLTAFFWGQRGTKVKQYKGSFTPFAGWEVVRSVRKPAPAIVIESPATAWSVAVWSWENGTTSSARFAAFPRMAHWMNSEAWEITLPFQKNILHIRRDKNTLFVRDDTNTGKVETLALTKGADLHAELKQIRNGYTNAAKKYPKFRAALGYRVKITWLLVFIFVAQEILLAFYKKMYGKYYVSIRSLNMICWAGGGVWLFMFYFGV